MAVSIACKIGRDNSERVSNVSVAWNAFFHLFFYVKVKSRVSTGIYVPIMPTTVRRNFAWIARNISLYFHLRRRTGKDGAHFGHGYTPKTNKMYGRKTTPPFLGWILNVPFSPLSALEDETQATLHTHGGVKTSGCFLLQFLLSLAPRGYTSLSHVNTVYVWSGKQLGFPRFANSQKRCSSDEPFWCEAAFSSMWNILLSKEVPQTYQTRSKQTRHCLFSSFFYQRARKKAVLFFVIFFRASPTLERPFGHFIW